MQTKRLYWDDPYKKEFAAKIVEVRGNALVLDETCFYPEGGGQVSDHGTINGKEVIDVRKAEGDEGTILHFFNEPDMSGFTAGQEVSGKIDWEKRYPTMKLHSSAHITYFVIQEILGPCTANSGKVDWEKDRSDYTMPEGKTFSDEVIKAIETRANEIIVKNYPITLDYAHVESRDSNPWTNAPNTAIQAGLRRTWKIDPFPIMECGGTHVKSTGEIGGITLKRGKKPGKGRERLESYLKA